MNVYISALEVTAEHEWRSAIATGALRFQGCPMSTCVWVTILSINTYLKLRTRV